MHQPVDHSAYRLHRPSVEALPIVLDSPHSGFDWPDDFDTVLSREAIRDTEDCFVDRLYERAPSFGATLLAARFPRAYIDPNRELADIDAELMAEPWPGPVSPSPKTRLGIGLVWRLSDGQPLYARRLTVAEVRRRIEHCWRPYHAALNTLLDDAHALFGCLWHLNVHSMGDEAYRKLGLPEPLADFVLGDLDGTTADEPTMALIETVLRDHGFSVARNDPFKGVAIIRNSGRPAEGRRALQIEVKKSIYMDRQAIAPNAGFARVQLALEAMLQALAAHARAQG